jgi:dihydroorotate dehydrogenase
VLAALAAFIERGVYPTWFTLNLSCPNTEDDPTGHQTADQARQLCRAAVDYLSGAGARLAAPPVSSFKNSTQMNTDNTDQKRFPLKIKSGTRMNADRRGLKERFSSSESFSHSMEAGDGAEIPLWVKVGPNLSAEQYGGLMRVFAETGVRAVVATNTLPVPSPADSSTMAGVGGGRLHDQALKTAAALMQEKSAHGYAVDVIGCGGVLDGTTYHDFADLGVQAVQYWSALVYRGPFAAALIAHEAKR